MKISTIKQVLQDIYSCLDILEKKNKNALKKTMDMQEKIEVSKIDTDNTIQKIENIEKLIHKNDLLVEKRYQKIFDFMGDDYEKKH